MTIGDVVYAIKNKRGKVISFIQKYGGAVKKSDTDVKIGKELTALMVKATPDMEKEFFSIASRKSSNASGIDPISIVSSSISDIFSSSANRKATEQQGQDAITLALINASAQKGSSANTGTYIALGVLGVVIVAVVVIIIYKKSKN